MSQLALIIAAMFSPIAGLIAILVTYQEYSRHYSDRSRPLRLALEAGLVTFVVFFALALVAGFLLNAILSGPT